MNTEKMREEFEAWIFHNKPRLSTYQYNGLSYRDSEVQSMWETWKASRAALVVDLEHIGYVQVEEGMFYLTEGGVIEVLREAGITVRNE